MLSQSHTYKYQDYHYILKALFLKPEVSINIWMLSELM